MKKLSALFLIFVLLFSACASEPLSYTPDALSEQEAVWDDCYPPPDEPLPEPNENDITAEELLDLYYFSQRVTNSIVLDLPFFDDIHEVGLFELLILFKPEADIEYDDEELGISLLGENGQWASISGFYPATIEEYFKENINPDFSIENYDYKNNDSIEPGRIYNLGWDEEKCAILYISLSGGFGEYTTFTIVDAYKHDDFYYIHTLFQFENNDSEYMLHAFKKNANGIFNIYSKQPTTAPAVIKGLDMSAQNTALTNDDIVEISRMTDLIILNFNFQEQVNDFSPLKKLKNLRVLFMRGTGVSDDDINALEAALPHCIIITEW